MLQDLLFIIYNNAEVNTNQWVMRYNRKENNRLLPKHD